MGDDANGTTTITIQPRCLEPESQKTRFGQSGFPGVTVYRNPPKLEDLIGDRIPPDEIRFAPVKLHYGIGEAPQTTLESPLVRSSSIWLTYILLFCVPFGHSPQQLFILLFCGYERLCK